MKYSIVWVTGLWLGGLAFGNILPSKARAASMSVVPASPFNGATICKPYASPIACEARPFKNPKNLASVRSANARPAVTFDVIPGYETIHQPQFVNDGYYGNGASWIGNSYYSWLKIDLGKNYPINRVTFGRDRLGNFDDRDPGEFMIEVAISDNRYANGDDSKDSTEYTRIVDSTTLGFNGRINGAATLQVDFAPVIARYVKITFQNPGAAIDEVEVFSIDEVAVFPSVPDPFSILQPFSFR